MKGIFSNLKNDLPAGVVVFLVALPLCLGVALASGAPLYSGMIAGIVGGIMIGIFSNSQLSVSGPAAGLAAIVAVQIQTLGSFQAFLVSIVLAGLIQIIFGALKFGTIANYFPTSVIKGMLTAIGILIIMKQIPHALGYDKDTEGDMEFLQADGENTFSAIYSAVTQYIHVGSTLLAIMCIGIILLWERPFMKRFKLIPPALIGVILSIIINQLFISSGSAWAIPQEDLVNVPIANNFTAFINQFTFPDFSQLSNSKIYIAAGTIAIVASIETLLSIEAVDKIDPHRRMTNTNRELFAQGIGNVVSGLIGGLPVTSVIVRSSANVTAGGQTKLATIFHGSLLLICVALIPGILNMIPLSALAAILIMTGYKLAKPALFKEMWSKGKYQFAPFIITIVVIVFTDLLIGVGVGIAVAVFGILRGNMKAPYFFHRSSHKETNTIKIQLAQEVSFLNKASIKLTLDHLPERSNVIIDASDTVYIDYDVLEIIREFEAINAPEKNIKVVLMGFKENYNINNSEHVTSSFSKETTNEKPQEASKLIDEISQ